MRRGSSGDARTYDIAYVGEDEVEGMLLIHEAPVEQRVARRETDEIRIAEQTSDALQRERR